MTLSTDLPMSWSEPETRPLEKAAISDVIAGQLGPKTETPQPISAMDTEG